MYTIEYAKNPARISNDTINLTVKFLELNEEFYFTASPNDPMDYGRQLYANAVAGMYGIVTSDQQGT